MRWKLLLFVSLILLLGATTAGVLAVDVDADGIGSVEELGTSNPVAKDTDGDGLHDGFEQQSGANPTVVDTDGDGLADVQEYCGSFDRGFCGKVDTAESPLEWTKSDPTMRDTDGDGIDDLTEFDERTDPTKMDSDGDGIEDPQELNGPTVPWNPDTDGDNLLDGWEISGETDKGARLPGANPLHKDMYIQVTYLRGVEQKYPSAVLQMSEEWFAEMPVENPDGETGINAHFFNTGKYSGQIDQSIDVWVHEDGSTTKGVSGFMAMREFYNRNHMGPRVGSYFLVVVPNRSVPLRAAGSAGGSKTSIVVPWRGYQLNDPRARARMITHELLHNLVREIGGQECFGELHTCEGFLSYEDDYFLSEVTANKLNEEGFADPVYPEQMNAPSCEETIYDPSLCSD